MRLGSWWRSTRCDAGNAAVATTMRLFLTGGASYLTISLSSNAGVGDLTYCKGSLNDPGNTGAISPPGAALADVFPHP